jgi:hypothetical protein
MAYSPLKKALRRTVFLKIYWMMDDKTLNNRMQRLLIAKELEILQVDVKARF